jgi:two pore calcium channel protein 3
MILFIFFYVLFFALLGYRIFRGSVEGVRYFHDYAKSAFNMLVLLTTANSPDIMLPAFEYSRPLALFFVVYLLFGVFLLMNLLMALFYSNYKDRLTKQMKDFHTERDQYLDEKFEELDKEKKGYLNK